MIRSPHSRTSSLVVYALLTAVSLLVAGRASAFVHFGNGLGSKWGPDPAAGTPAVVTWGFMPDGTEVDPDFELDPWSFPGETGFTGTSQLTSLRHRIDVTMGHGEGAFDAALARAFATWSAVTNVTFVGPVDDPGLPFPTQGAVTPDIRIGAFMPLEGHSFNWVGAVGFGPPGFGPDPLAGDILFNLAATIDIVAGVEDVTPIPPFTNDLEGLFLHELGHAAFGLGHPSWEGEEPDQRVMYVGDFENPNAPPGSLTINRALHPDDLAGARFVYGLRGDYNDDGHIDAADYTVWRNHVGTNALLPNDPLGGTIGANQYAQWKANYGAIATSMEAGLTRSVSEPAMGMLLLASLVSVRLFRHIPYG